MTWYTEKTNIKRYSEEVEYQALKLCHQARLLISIHHLTHSLRVEVELPETRNSHKYIDEKCPLL